MAAQDELVSIRLSNDVLTRLQKVTKHKKGGRSRALRIVIDAGMEAQNLDALRQRVQIFDKFTDELKAIRSDLSRVGGNLNQLARLFNNEKFSESDLKALSLTHGESRTQFESLIKLLKKIQDETGRI